MSRTEEVNRLTERVYKLMMEQFNPTLRCFVNTAKTYQKALMGVSVAAKAYFDSLVSLGELASDSQGAKELGDTLFQMAEIHRQIQLQMEDMARIFHSEFLMQLEQKLELDVKYLSAALRRYQLEIRTKTESIAKCHSELRKIRRKSGISKNPQKYGDREMQFVELISEKQGELDKMVARGYTTALTEERRRYCFLVERHCTLSKHFGLSHSKVSELLRQKLTPWMNSCSDPGRIPERARILAFQTATSHSGSATPAQEGQPAPTYCGQPAGGGTAPPGDSPGPRKSPREGDTEAQRQQTTEGVQVWVGEEGAPAPDGSSGQSGRASEGEVNPNSATLWEHSAREDVPVPVGSVPRVPRRTRVCAVFAHAAEKDDETLLSFLPEDTITVLVSDAKDGWQYGQSEVTNKKGWFPASYTQPLQETIPEQLSQSNLQSSWSNSSSTGQLDKLGVSSGIPGNKSSIGNGKRSFPSSSNTRARPFSLMDPDIPQLTAEFGNPQTQSSRQNPFANVRLKRTITNDRSAPVVR